MTKVSTNAGKHPYRRTDSEYQYLFDHLKNKEAGIKIDHTKQPYFNVVVNSDFLDKKKNELFFKDVVLYCKDEYIIDYDGKNFCWIIRLIKDLTKIENLNKVSNKIILHKKYNKR